MGKQAKAKKDLDAVRTVGYLDSNHYPEKKGAEIIYDDHLRANVYEAYKSNHIDTSGIKVEPFMIELGGFALKVQQIDQVFVVDVHITAESQGRVAIRFGDVLLLNWNKREIIESDDFLITNLPESIQNFISLTAINEIVIYSILGINKGIAKIKIAEKKGRVERENFDVDLTDTKKEKAIVAEGKEPEYVTESWTVSSYKRKDGTSVSGYESSRNPNLLKRVENQ